MNSFSLLMEVIKMEPFQQDFPWPQICHCPRWTQVVLAFSKKKALYVNLRERHEPSTKSTPTKSSNKYYSDFSEGANLVSNSPCKLEIAFESWNFIGSAGFWVLIQLGHLFVAPRGDEISKLWLDFYSNHYKMNLWHVLLATVQSTILPISPLL